MIDPILRPRPALAKLLRRAANRLHPVPLWTIRPTEISGCSSASVRIHGDSSACSVTLRAD